MKFTCNGFLRRWFLTLCGIGFFFVAGCQKPTDVERAAYDYDDEGRDEPIRKSAGRRNEIRSSAKPKSVAKKPRGAVQFTTASTPAETTKSPPIATPVPAQIIAAAEAESTSLPTGYVGRSAPSVAPQLKTTAAPTLDWNAALRQADERNRNGAAAYAKGAWFTARVEFSEALNQLAASLDARDGGSRRMTALAAGLTALSEAEAFSGRVALTPANVSATMAAHQTAPFVGPFPSGVTPTTLHDAYVHYAVERLTESVAGCEAGSVALHGLGKVHNAADATIVDGRSKAHAFYVAALAVGPGNFLAANDLAVLLAEAGRLEQARDLLHDALRRSPQPAMWNNLSAVHDRLGRPDLAQLARQESAALERRAVAAPGSVLPTHNVAWLDPRSFAATSRTGPETSPPTAAAPGGASPSNVAPVAAPAAKPITGVTQRPLNRVLAY